MDEFKALAFGAFLAFALFAACHNIKTSIHYEKRLRALEIRNGQMDRIEARDEQWLNEGKQ